MRSQLGGKSIEKDARRIKVLIGGASASGGPTDHGELLGLGDDDHSQYVHLSAPRVITARHTFAPTTAQAPFTLGANAQGQLVAGFNADRLDGQDGSYYLDWNNLANVPAVFPPAAHTHLWSEVDKSGSSLADLETREHDDLEGVGPSDHHNPVTVGFGLGLNTQQVYVDQAMVPTWTGIHKYSAAGQPTNDLGTDWGYYNHKWRTIYAAELFVQTLVAQDVMATVGGQIVVAPTTKLIANCGSGATTIDVEHNSLTNGDYVQLKTAPAGVPQLEIMRITGTPTTITGGYRYSVTRNLDGTGANDWFAGDAVLKLGAGFIDLTSTSTTLADLGPTIAIYDRTDTANWNDIAPVVAMGNLQSFLDYSAETYGFAAGNNLDLTPSTGFKGMAIDATNGARLFNTDVALYNGATQTGFLGSNAVLKLGTNIANTATTQFDFDPLTGNLALTGNIIATGGSFSGVINIGTSGGIWQGSSGTFASPTTGFKIYNSGGVGLWESWYGGTKQVYLDTDMSLKAGAGAVTIDSDGINISPSSSYVNPDYNSLKFGQTMWLGGSTTGFPELAINTQHASAGNISIYNRTPNLSDSQVNISASSGVRVSNLTLFTSTQSTAYAGILSLTLAGYSAFDIQCSSNSDNFIDIQVPLRRHGATGGIYVPLASAYSVWATAARNSATGTISLSGSYIPASAIAVSARIWFKQVSTSGDSYFFYIGNSEMVARATVTNRWADNSGIAGLSASRTLNYSISAYGTGDAYCGVTIYGYFI